MTLPNVAQNDEFMRYYGAIVLGIQLITALPRAYCLGITWDEMIIVRGL